LEKVRAKKHLGQHFLNDEVIAKDIVLALQNTVNYKNVLEVGPGMGVLTNYLLEQPDYTTTVVELDKESIAYLTKNYGSTLNGRIIQDDFLRLDLSKLFDSPFAIIGNFPYNISSQIVFHILEHRDAIPFMVGMFQKEVAERIGAKHGGKEYGIMSVITQAFYNVEYLFTVHEYVFTPPPKVKSGVIRLTRKEGELGCDESMLRKVVKTAFNQRRKKLRNAISTFGLNDEELGFFASKRAEELSVDQFIELTNLIASKK